MSPELDLLRPALELAIAVARSEAKQNPPIEPPRALAPYLSFRKLPAKALAASRRALDDDPEFRARVHAAGDSAALGEASELLLARPELWSERLAALVEERASRERDAEEGRMSREAERLGQQIDKLRRRVAETEAQRNTAVQRETAAMGRIETLQVALEDLSAQLSAAEAARQRAVRELKEVERRLAERTAEVRALRDRLDSVSGEAAAATFETERRAAAEHHGAQQAVLRGEADRALVEALRQRWDAVGPALGEIQRLLAIPDQDPARLLRQAQTAQPGRATGAASSRPRKRDREALRLPARLAHGTPEATRWLMSRPGATVYIDGYNVTMLAWPELTAGEQRVALERAARRLQAQLGSRMVLVFDGDDEGGREIRSAVGSPVRVLFTARTVEADDEILAQLDARTEPAVVVTNDKRVQAGARERGAEVVRSDEFIALAR
ncbi:MAG: hypothetical protein GX868_03050 [Actinobacteria bacterium]|nr:hypothetical protein [Actinomycetota bacterium]